MADLIPSFGILFTVQRTSDGANFDGAAPAGVAVEASRVRTFPEGAIGGLFSFDSVLTVVDQVRIHLPGGSAYTVFIQRDDGTNDLVKSESGLAAVNAMVQGPIYLSSGEKIRITTAGAAGQNKAYAKVVHRPWQRVTY